MVKHKARTFPKLPLSGRTAGLFPPQGCRFATRAKREAAWFLNGHSSNKRYSQQYPAGLAVYSAHGVVVGDGFFPEVYNLHKERFVSEAKVKELVSSPGRTLCQSKPC